MTYILIYEIIPETIMIFKFDEPDKQMAELLSRCHQVYINNDENIDKDVEKFLSDLPEENMIFDDTAQDNDISKLQILNNGSVQIIVAGFMF